MSNMEAFNKIMSEIGEQLNEETITAIKAALEAKVEPVAWMSTHDVGFKKSEFGNTPTIPLYTTPPQRTWVGLTDEEIDVIYEQHHNQYGECESVNLGYERAIEAKLKEKNETN
jgi:hypothetical protein